MSRMYSGAMSRLYIEHPVKADLANSLPRIGLCSTLNLVGPDKLSESVFPSTETAQSDSHGTFCVSSVLPGEGKSCIQPRARASAPGERTELSGRVLHSEGSLRTTLVQTSCLEAPAFRLGKQRTGCLRRAPETKFACQIRHQCFTSVIPCANLLVLGTPVVKCCNVISQRQRNSKPPFLPFLFAHPLWVLCLLTRKESSNVFKNMSKTGHTLVWSWP